MNGAIFWHDLSWQQALSIEAVPDGHLGKTAAIYLGCAGSVFRTPASFQRPKSAC